MSGSISKKTDFDLQDLIQMSKMASVGHLVGGVGHEINNPLAILQGNIEITMELLRIQENLTPELQSFLEGQQLAVDRITQIIRDLCLFVKIDEEDEVLSLHSLINNTIQFVETIYKKAGVDFKKKLCADPIPQVFANRGEIQQVILSIFSNSFESIKAQKTKDEYEIFPGEIFIETNVSDEECQLILSDNGIGISEKVIDQIFDPFFTTKENHQKNPGIGLAICSEVMTKCGGTIKLKETSEKGTSFLLTFPLSKN